MKENEINGYKHRYIWLGNKKGKDLNMKDYQKHTAIRCNQFISIQRKNFLSGSDISSLNMKGTSHQHNYVDFLIQVNWVLSQIDSQLEPGLQIDKVIQVALPLVAHYANSLGRLTGQVL